MLLFLGDNSTIPLPALSIISIDYYFINYTIFARKGFK